jgi:AbrB family looped-hinge helix DNA binding protein
MPELTVKIDRAGRVSIPKRLRDKLRLKPGDSLAIESYGEQLTLRPATEPGRLKRKGRFWVIEASEPMPADIVERMIEEIRLEREASFL